MQPYNQEFNAYVTRVAKELMPQGWDAVSDPALFESVPQSTEQGEKNFLATGRFKFISAPTPSETIFADQSVDNAFLAILLHARHDVLDGTPLVEGYDRAFSLIYRMAEIVKRYFGDEPVLHVYSDMAALMVVCEFGMRMLTGKRVTRQDVEDIFVAGEADGWTDSYKYCIKGLYSVVSSPEFGKAPNVLEADVHDPKSVEHLVEVLTQAGAEPEDIERLLATIREAVGGAPTEAAREAAKNLQDYDGGSRVQPSVATVGRA